MLSLQNGLLASLLVANLAVAETATDPGGVRFQRVGSESGPPAEVVTALLQDNTGFVWIGSLDGLSRFDGREFVEFRYRLGDPTSLSDNTIRVIFEDSGGYLWVGTNSAGLNRLDRASNSFEHFRHDSSDPGSLSHDSVYSIAEDSRGNLWIGTQSGLNRFNRETGVFERFLADPEAPDGLSESYVVCLLVDGEDRLWVGTNGGGLGVLDPGSRAFRTFRHDPENPRSLSSDAVFTLYQDQAGRIWAGTKDGLCFTTPSEGEFGRIQTDPSDPASLSNNTVVALAEGVSGKIWAGTLAGGLNEVDAATGRCRVFRHQTGSPNSLGDDRISCLLKDADETLWAGTWGGGLWRLNQTALLLGSGAAQVPVPPGVSTKSVSALAADREGDLWIGTRAGDLFRKGADSAACERIEGAFGSILSLVRADTDRLWIGTPTGLVRFDLRTSGPTWFQHDPEDPESLGPGYINALLLDREEGLWVGTGEGGLMRLSNDGKVVFRIGHDPADSASLSEGFVRSIAQDRHGMIWVGTRSGGLNRVDPATETVTRFVPDPDDPHAISHGHVTDIYEDTKGRLWIATGGGGLNRLEIARDGLVRFVRFTTAEGLLDDNVMAIVEDDDGSLWLSTKGGLSRFDPESERFSQLYIGDGLPSAEFESGAAARTSSTLYFGSVRWVAAAPGGSAFPNDRPSPVIISSIRTAGGEIFGDQPAWRRQRVVIPYGQWLDVNLAVLDFNPEHRHRHRFRLRGLREDWVDLGSRTEITFVDLDPGHYTFEARAQNCRGVWNDVSPSLAIYVPPPLWMTWWFRGGLAIMVIVAVIGAHRRRTAVLKRRNRELEELQEQREHARQELAIAYDRLRQLTRRLEAAKEEERKRIALELHDDMGPALTAVIINLQLISTSGDAEKTPHRLEESIDIVDRMVEQIRDLSLALRPPLLDDVGLVPALKGYLETVSERTGLEINVAVADTVGSLPPEIEITAFRVVQEAVSNVVRHAEARHVAIRVGRHNGVLELAIEDDGVGFDVVDTIQDPTTGRALGLLGMEERVRGLNGTFEIESDPGSGTRILAALPVELVT